MQGKLYVEQIGDAVNNAAEYISESAQLAMDAVTGKTNE